MLPHFDSENVVTKSLQATIEKLDSHAGPLHSLAHHVSTLDTGHIMNATGGQLEVLRGEGGY